MWVMKMRCTFYKPKTWKVLLVQMHGLLSEQNVMNMCEGKSLHYDAATWWRKGAFMLCPKSKFGCNVNSCFHLRLILHFRLLNTVPCMTFDLGYVAFDLNNIWRNMKIFLLHIWLKFGCNWTLIFSRQAYFQISGYQNSVANDLWPWYVTMTSETYGGTHVVLMTHPMVAIDHIGPKRYGQSKKCVLRYYKQRDWHRWIGRP